MLKTSSKRPFLSKSIVNCGHLTMGVANGYKGSQFAKHPKCSHVPVGTLNADDKYLLEGDIISLNGC